MASIVIGDVTNFYCHQSKDNLGGINALVENMFDLYTVCYVENGERKRKFYKILMRFCFFFFHFFSIIYMFCMSVLFFKYFFLRY